MPSFVPVFCALWVLLTASALSALAPVDIPVSQLPAPVAAALRKHFPAARANAAQKSEERNDYVYFYVTISTGNQLTLITITEVGEIVSSAPAKPATSPRPGS